MRGARGIRIIAVVAAIILVVGLVVAGIGLSIGGHHYNGKTASFSEAIDQEITSLDISVEYGSLEIIEGDEFRIVAENFRDNTLEWEVSGGRLTVKEDSSKNWKMFYFGWNEAQKLTIYVKKGTLLNEADISIGAGRLYGQALHAKSITLDCGAGTVEIDEISGCEDMDISCGAGMVDVKADITRKIEIDNGVGYVSLDLIGEKEDYSVHTESGITSVKINGEDYRREDFPANADNRIDISNGIGEISISFFSE